MCVVFGWALQDPPTRLDDSADAPNQLTRPRVASRPDGAAALLVFEDDRDGWVRIRSQTVWLRASVARHQPVRERVPAQLGDEREAAEAALRPQ